MNKKIVIIGDNDEAKSFQEFFGLKTDAVVAINTMLVNDPEEGLTDKDHEEIKSGLRARPSISSTTYESIPANVVKDNLLTLIMEHGVSHIWPSGSVGASSVINEIQKIAKMEGIAFCKAGYSFNPKDNRCKHVYDVLELSQPA